MAIRRFKTGLAIGVTVKPVQGEFATIDCRHDSVAVPAGRLSVNDDQIAIPDMITGHGIVADPQHEMICWIKHGAEVESFRLFNILDRAAGCDATFQRDASKGPGQTN